jgi:stage IV sporulation protein FB
MVLKHADSITVKPYTYFYMALLLFFVPLQWLFAWLLALCVHELCHIAAVRLCGGTISHLTVDIGGMEMKTSPLTEWKRFVAILSGPVGGFLLIFLGRWFPRLALCSWMLSVYNLLPLHPLDGGRALQILLGDPDGFRLVEKIFLVILTVAALYAVFVLRLGVIPAAIVFVLWLRNRKIPCKEDVCKVQ